MEKFKRLARWDYVGNLKRELNIPVAGNGDLQTSEDLVRRSAGPCNAVMVGRAAVRQPWIFADAKDLFERDSREAADAAILRAETQRTQREDKREEQRDIEGIGIMFLELLSQYQPPEFHVSRAMRFFSFFCDNLKFGNYLKTQLNREKTLSGIESIWRGYFRTNES
jgi:tRNA-dihydrouridine synthase